VRDSLLCTPRVTDKLLYAPALKQFYENTLMFAEFYTFCQCNFAHLYFARKDRLETLLTQIILCFAINVAQKLKHQRIFVLPAGTPLAARTAVQHRHLPHGTQHRAGMMRVEIRQILFREKASTSLSVSR
jgi:hypothetical protein